MKSTFLEKRRSIAAAQVALEAALHAIGLALRNHGENLARENVDQASYFAGRAARLLQEQRL